MHTQLQKLQNRSFYTRSRTLHNAYIYLEVGGGGIKQSLTQLEPLHGKVEVVAIGKLVQGCWNTGALVNPGGLKEEKLRHQEHKVKGLSWTYSRTPLFWTHELKTPFLHVGKRQWRLGTRLDTSLRRFIKSQMHSLRINQPLK